MRLINTLTYLLTYITGSSGSPGRYGSPGQLVPDLVESRVNTADPVSPLTSDANRPTVIKF